ncbi:unnamed protein product [Urochloa humidicola]
METGMALRRRCCCLSRGTSCSCLLNATSPQPPGSAASADAPFPSPRQPDCSSSERNGPSRVVARGHGCNFVASKTACWPSHAEGRDHG